jgi:hypothetical protein
MHFSKSLTTRCFHQSYWLLADIQNRTTTLAITAPPYLICVVVIMINGWHSDKKQERTLHIIVPFCVTVIANIIALSTTNIAARYVAMILLPGKYLLLLGLPSVVLTGRFLLLCLDRYLVLDLFIHDWAPHQASYRIRSDQLSLQRKSPKLSRACASSLSLSLSLALDVSKSSR